MIGSPRFHGHSEKTASPALHRDRNPPASPWRLLKTSAFSFAIRPKRRDSSRIVTFLHTTVR